MRLMNREKAIVIGGVGFVIVLAILQLAVRPTMERISTLRRVVTDKRDTLAQLQRRSREYAQLEAEVKRLRAAIGPQEESRKILSTIERIRQACGLSEKALSLKPTTMPINEDYQETVVEVRFESVTWPQLVQFLSQVDALELAGGIKTLEAKHAERNPGALGATLRLVVVSSIEYL